MDDFDSFDLRGALVKLVVGIAAVGALIDLAGTAGDRASAAYENAARAASHAVADGRADLGTLENRNGERLQDLEVQGRSADLPTPVPLEDAATAVAADELVSSLYLELGNVSYEDTRWYFGGAGAVALLTAGSLYKDGLSALKARRRRRRRSIIEPRGTAQTEIEAS